MPADAIGFGYHPDGRPMYVVRLTEGLTLYATYYMEGDTYAMFWYTYDDLAKRIDQSSQIEIATAR